MPQRFLKPGITASRKWDKCGWMTQSFYIRIITLVDDYGRYEADATLLRSHCFPLRDDIKTTQVDSMRKELSDVGLAIFYTHGDKEYLQLTNWTERARANDSKFPEFDSTCCQLFANVAVGGEGGATNDGKPQDSAANCGKILPSSSSSSSSVIRPRPSSPSYPLAHRIGGWFGRREHTVWSVKELKALKEVSELLISDDDMNALESYYTFDHPKESDYRRRDIATLLNNLTGEIDRARKWKQDQDNQSSKHNNGF